MFLQLKNITKTYPGVVALDDVSLEITEGEVHALVGENGAGKSTLIKTCTGAITPDKGTIIIKGQEFSGLTPKTSEQMGVGVIYQEFNLVDELSVAENIFLGRAIRKGIVIDRKAMRQGGNAARMAHQLAHSVDVNVCASISSVLSSSSTLGVGTKALLTRMSSPPK